MAFLVTKTLQRESGFQGSLYSLGGLYSSNGLGRKRSRYQAIGLITESGIIVPENPKRICCFFYQFNGSSSITLGQDDNSAVYLATGDYFQIDYRIPWTGSVFCYFTGAGTLIANEIGLE